ncbi:unnamed protein product [Symbiodinium natans]|uniref:Uncharacterized protein n=1 Tax=Symbiodinium natans TaxID=878477 RepID=A0A812GRD8_9DINO|nr:unnamed protein product [Symbiodinium natans]
MSDVRRWGSASSLLAYSTDLRKDYKKIFGEDHKPAVEAVEATEAEPDVQDVEVTEPKAVAASAVPTDPTVVRRFPAGSKVVIKGLTGGCAGSNYRK